MGNDTRNWHLPAWAERAGKRQADMVRDLDVTKNSAHKLWYGRQAVTQDQIEALAAWVGVRPYKLFIRPAEADALDLLRATAKEIAEGMAKE